MTTGNCPMNAQTMLELAEWFEALPIPEPPAINISSAAPGLEITIDRKHRDIIVTALRAALPPSLEVDDGDVMDDFIRAVLADNNPRSDEPYATVAKWIRKLRRPSQEVPAPPQRMWSAPAEFVMWALMEGAWQGADVDGGASQDKAVELGLIVATQYDPKKHGETAYCEPGDQWFVPSESLLAALAGKPGAEPQRPADALRLLADLFSESLHETWTRGEIVNVIEDAIRLGSSHARPDRNPTENIEGGA